jgi:hypothetical protein
MYNIHLTNYGQNAYFWTFLTFSHEGKSRNATQNRDEKDNIYLTNSLEENTVPRDIKMSSLDPCIMREYRNLKITLSCSSIIQGRGHFNISRNYVFF